MAAICPHPNTNCHYCNEYLWDKHREQMACFLGRKKPEEDIDELLMQTRNICQRILVTPFGKRKYDTDKITDLYTAAKQLLEAENNLSRKEEK